MESLRRRILHNVHVYFMEMTFFIPTVVRQSNGIWRETPPVYCVPFAETEHFADAIQTAREASVIAEPTAFWDGNGRKVWDDASLRWSLYWWDDGTLAIVPKYLIPLQSDPETGDILDGGWTDDKERTRVVPGETPPDQVAKLLVSFVVGKVRDGDRLGRILKVVTLNQEHLGSIFLDADGDLSLEIADERFRDDLEALLARIRSEPLYLTTGERSEEGDQVTFTTRRKYVRPGDADFLTAVQELLRKVRFGETRVRGLLLRGAGNHEP